MGIFIDDALEIGTGAADPTSAIDIVSTTKGFLPPRMTTIERDAIVSPATGLEIYNIDNSRPEFFNGLIWTFPAGAPSGNPGGSNREIQFNDNSVFGGAPDFIFDGKNVGISNAAPDAKLDIFDDGSTGEWAIQTSSGDNSWQNVAFGNGVFVAISDTSGTANQVMTSPDGITWTAQTSALNVLWQDVAFGAGLFVAVFTTVTPTGGNQVMTSPDGITWTLQSCPAALWQNITFGGGQFVAVPFGGLGIAITSPDGITWTSQVLPLNGRVWRDIAFGNNTYVAISVTGTGDRGMTSPDGITWTLRPIPAFRWESITFGIGLFVAVSTDGIGNRVMTSPDGITWTQQTTPADNNWRQVTFGNGVFMAVANTGTGNRAMSSTDGINWTIETTPVDNSWQGVGFGNNRFVSVAISGTGDRAMLFATVLAQTSILKLDSITSGFLPPRMTTAERDLILSPTGLEIYNTTTNQPEFFDGFAWQAMTGALTNPGGTDTEIQFNDNGNFGGNGRFIFTGTAVGIGGAAFTPDGSAILDLDTVFKGFLPPRMIEPFRNTIPSPATGLQIHNQTTNQPEFFDGAVWQPIGGLPTIPGGANTQIQFNDSGAFNGSLDFVFNGSAVGIGTSTPDSSAALEINSTLAGFLKPVMTTIQRDAIPIPAIGLEIYNTTTNQPEFFDGTIWTSPSGTATNPGGADTEIQFNNAGLFDGNSNFVFTGSAVGIGTNSPDPSAALEINSTISGFLKSVMTTAQRDLIPSPKDGLEVYNSTTNQPEYFDGIIWKAVSAPATNPAGADTQVQFNDSGLFGANVDFVFNGLAVGIGTSTPVASAVLELNSTIQGFLKPVMTTTQRDAIVSPALGLEIYNTTTNQPEFFDGAIWIATSGTATNPGGANTQIQFNDAGNFGADADFVFNGVSVGIGTSAPVANAALELNSTTQAFLPSRMTTTQRNAIPSPESGLMLYNTSQNRVNVFNGSSWKQVAWTTDIDSD